MEDKGKKMAADNSDDVLARFNQTAKILRRIFEEEPYTNGSSAYNALSNNFRCDEPKMVTSNLVFKDADGKDLALVIVQHPPSSFLANYTNTVLALEEYPHIAEKWHHVVINFGAEWTRAYFEKIRDEEGVPKAMTDKEIPDYMRNMRMAYDSGEREKAEAIGGEFASRLLVAHHVVQIKVLSLS